MSDAAIVQSPTITAGTTFLSCGSSLGSSNPTMTSVNADYTHFNQAVALYNRRTNQVMATPDTFSYFSSNQIPAADLTSLRTKINTLRSTMGLTSFSFTGSLSAGNKIRAIHLNELFTAIPSSGVTKTATNLFRYEVENVPYGTFHSGGAGVAAASNSAYIGKSFLHSAGAPPNGLRRERMGFTIANILSNLASTVVCTLHIAFDTWNNAEETATPAFYCGTTTVASSGNTWYDDDISTFINYGTAGLSGDQEIDVAYSIINSFGGSGLNVVVGQSLELIGTGSGGTNTTGKSSFNWDNSSIATPYLEYDFGF